VEQLCVNVVRGLAMDAPQAASSGHPGTAMALAPLAHVLFSRVMRHDPGRPDWPTATGVILSNGHASILLYSMLFLNDTGSVCKTSSSSVSGDPYPGHPEVHGMPGSRSQPGRLARDSPTGSAWPSPSDSCVRTSGLRHRSPHLRDLRRRDLMEGVSHEAASLAGHLGLGRLVYVFDDNHITIDGPTDLACSDDVVKRFEAYGWHVERLARWRTTWTPSRLACVAASSKWTARRCWCSAATSAGPRRISPTPRRRTGTPLVLRRCASPRRFSVCLRTRSSMFQRRFLRSTGSVPDAAERRARPGRSAKRCQARTGTGSRPAFAAGVCADGPTASRPSRPAPSWPRAKPSTSA